MNKLILCEGVTDAILLSYYLEKVAGWVFGKGPKNLSIKTNEGNESVNWYRRGDDYLLICGVGGKDNFSKFFDEKIKKPLITSNAFERIAVVTDRDDREIHGIEAEMESVFLDDLCVQNGCWCENKYQDSFGIEQAIDFLLVVVPSDHQGALETAMLDAISENPYDRNIVNMADAFLKQMRVAAARYISSDRLQLKAHLGVTWAVQYPEKVFSLIDQQIKSVHWEDSKVLRDCFAELERI